MTLTEFDERYRVQHIHSNQYVVYDRGATARDKGKIVAGPFPKHRADGVLSFMRSHCTE